VTSRSWPMQPECEFRSLFCNEMGIEPAQSASRRRSATGYRNSPTFSTGLKAPNSW
jgi:hypothetical protein